METYQYKARDKFGKLVAGLMEGSSPGAIASKLREMNYAPLSIKEAGKASDFYSVIQWWGRIRFSDLNMFIRQFAALQKAGIPIMQSLRTLGREATRKRLKDVIEQVARDIEAGATLSGALGKHPRVFSPLQVNMVKAGEASGTLYQSLERLAELGEYEEKIRLRVLMATRYPLLVIAAIIIGVLILTTVVVPQFANIYGKFNTALPLPTRILIGANFAVTHYWWACILVAGLGAVSSLSRLWDTGRAGLRLAPGLRAARTLS